MSRKKKTVFVITVKKKGRDSVDAIVPKNALSKVAGPGAAKIIKQDNVDSVLTIYKNGGYERLNKIER